MNPGEILLVGVALMVSGWALSTWRRATRAARDQRARERQGARNAARAHEQVVVESCVLCGAPTVAAEDFFDDKTRQWWHRRCWQESVK